MNLDKWPQTCLHNAPIDGQADNRKCRLTGGYINPTLQLNRRLYSAPTTQSAIPNGAFITTLVNNGYKLLACYGDLDIMLP